VYFWPAMFTVATRTAPVFDAIDSPTVPLAFPLCPAVTTIQVTGLVAFQPHPLSVATSTDRRPPAAAMVSPARFNVNTQGAGAWLTATLCDPTTIAPVRPDGTGFGATV
jgi:hypothetical protein